MREPVRTTRRGRDAARTEPTPPTTRHAQKPGRRLRTRLLAAVLVSLVAVLAAGGPSVATAVSDVSQSQRLLRLTELNTSAIALSHALCDERDAMTAYAAAGRTGEGVSQGEQAAVDRQAAELGRDAADLDTGGSADLVRITGDLRLALGDIDRVRGDARTGNGSARAVFDSYTPLVDALDAVSGGLARALPDRASDPDTSAGPALTEAVSQASAEHGLLVAALDGTGAGSDLVGEARTDRLREQGAFDDFDTTATADARTRYAQTVTGTDVTAADGYLDKLTAGPGLTAADHRLDPGTVDQALSARIDRMRAVQSSLAAADTTRLTALRDQDVTALEIRCALVGLCALVALAIGVQTARSVTRPLARVRRYANDPAGEPPTASGDEFALIALDVQRLAQDLADLRERGAGQDAERVRLDGERDTAARSAAAEHEELRRREAALREERAALAREKEALAARLGSLQGSVHSTFVNLSLRTLALVERQLQLIEGLENREQDPDELKTLFRLDHLATRMRRNSESLLVLAGAETGGSAVTRPIPLVDVVRAGISEIERYERVRIPFLPRGHLVGFAADDAGHLVAELLENATAFSPPDSEVRVSGWLLENGEVMISVEDEGIGVPSDRLDEVNRLLADPRPDQSDAPAGLGLYVVARLAGRHGIRVQLRPQKQGGTAAVVVLPKNLITSAPPAGSDAPPAGRTEPAAGLAARTAPAVAPPRTEPAGHAAVPAPAAEHARPHAAGPDQAGTPARPRPDEPAADAAGGPLPKRVPRSSGLTGEPGARANVTPVDADALRRRLGGFAQGLREGRRDAEAEATAERPGDHSDSEPSEEARG